MIRRKLAISEDARQSTRLHELAGSSFANSLLGLGTPGLPLVSSMHREVVAEASYHFQEAMKCCRDMHDEYMRYRNLLADLCGAFNPTSWHMVRLSAGTRFNTVEPFIAMGQELLARATTPPSDQATKSLLQLIGDRLVGVHKNRRAEGDFDLQTDMRGMIATTNQMIANVSASLTGNAPMYGSVVELVKNENLKRLITDQNQLKVFKGLACDLVTKDGSEMEDVNPSFLQTIIAETYPGKEHRRARHSLYEKAFLTGHDTFADLFLGMLGTAPDELKAEALIEKYGPGIGPKFVGRLKGLGWQKATGQLLDDFRKGFDRFETYYTEPSQERKY